MNTHSSGKMMVAGYGDLGEYSGLRDHEFGHLFGLDDPNGKYYSPGGTMEYTGSINMKPISSQDIKNIINFAKDALNCSPDATKPNQSKVILLENKGKSDGNNPLGVKSK